MANFAGNNDTGIAAEPAYWSPQLNILFVIDGQINTSKDPNSFGLGYVLETLRSTEQPARLNVQVVRRDTGVFEPAGLTLPAGDNAYNADGSGPVTGFVFTEQTLAAWDQVWLFGDFPANLSDDHTEPRFSPLTDDELLCLATWMDRGGGVFAAGDHWNLGASMCSRIPRVRTMRRWIVAESPPSMDGATRHQTLQPNPHNGNPDVQEGDTYAQPIEVVRWNTATSDLDRPSLPHALLATPIGAIETFPDHMHEGDVVLDGDVQLDLPLGIAGYSGVEYPFAEIEVGAESTARLPPDLLPRPRPHVVAYGRTTNRYSSGGTGIAQAAPAGAPIDVPTNTTHRFAIIGAYDGDSAGIGRVVVESTWHHWFSYNLHGFVAEVSRIHDQYALMQTYYRNVAMWLATPAQRQLMLSGATWRTVVSNPMAFPLAPPRSLWAAGEHAVAAILQTVSRSMLVDFIASIYSSRPRIFSLPEGVDPSAPASASVSVDVTLRAMVGGIATSFVKPAYDYLYSGPRRLLDPTAIASRFLEGLSLGHSALVDTIKQRMSMGKDSIESLHRAFKPRAPDVPISFVKLRVVAEALQFPDPTDPCLVSRHIAGKSADPISIVLKVSLNRTVVAQEAIQEIQASPFTSVGALVKLDRVLYEGTVQSGESLRVEVVARKMGRGKSATDQSRFNDCLRGDPLLWIGRREPDERQSWRLWYRVENE